MAEHEHSKKQHTEKTPWTVSGDLRDPKAVHDFLRLGPGAAQQLIETAAHPDYEHHYRERVQRALAEAAFQSPLGTHSTGGFGIVEADGGQYYISLRPDSLGTRVPSEDLERYGLPELDVPSGQSSQEPEHVPASEPAPLLEEKTVGSNETVEEDTRPVNERISRLAGEVGLFIEDGERILDGIKDEGNHLGESIDAFESALNGGKSAVTRIRDLLDMVTPENIRYEASDSLVKLDLLVEDYAAVTRRANQLIDNGFIEANKTNFRGTVGNIGEAVHATSGQEGVSAEESNLYDRVHDTIGQIAADVDNLSFVTSEDTNTFPSASSLDMDVAEFKNALTRYSEGSVSRGYVRDVLDRLMQADGYGQAFPRFQEMLDELVSKRSKFDADLRTIKDTLGDVYSRINNASRELPRGDASTPPEEAPMSSSNVEDEFSERSVLGTEEGGYWTPDQEKDPTYLQRRRDQLRKGPRQAGGFQAPDIVTDDITNPFGT